MINTIEQFGRNAGMVWETLHTYGALTESQLMELTALRSYELHIAIGWLARENKIYFDGERYRLDTTNLTDQIGNDAGKVWRALSTQGDADIQSLARLTQLEKKEVYAALGWLAREDKIQ
ncbi:MAG TPA: hypothetical protein ENI51_06170, partial [Candidatus Atribacteria bacterium]|nr:hypothetical protein [Candidatus Atribacteria bacterium]